MESLPIIIAKTILSAFIGSVWALFVYHAFLKEEAEA